MPGMLAPGFKHIETQSGQRIGQRKHALHSKAGSHETLEWSAVKELTDEEARRNLISRHEGVAAFQRDPTGMPFGQVLIERDVVGIDSFNMRPGERCDGSTFSTEIRQPARSDEARKNRAINRRELASNTLDTSDPSCSPFAKERVGLDVDKFSDVDCDTHCPSRQTKSRI